MKGLRLDPTPTPHPPSLGFASARAPSPTREIKALAASGHGVLFTTHDPNHALRAAHRAFLLHGTALTEGKVAEVLNRTQLEQLYRAPVEQLADPDSGGAAFLPGW